MSWLRFLVRARAAPRPAVSIWRRRRQLSEEYSGASRSKPLAEGSRVHVLPSFPRARGGGASASGFDLAAPAPAIGNFFGASRSKPLAEGGPAFTVLPPFPRAREGGASASGFDSAAPARSYGVGFGASRSKPLAEGWLWRVCALAFQAGAIVLLIRGRAGAKAARGE